MAGRCEARSERLRGCGQSGVVELVAVAHDGDELAGEGFPDGLAVTR